MKRQSQGRAQRRLYEKFLKKFHPEQFKTWKSGVLERGIKAHEQHFESIRKSEEEHYEAMQTRMIQSMKADGKSNEEIDAYIEDWVQTLKLWGSNERPKRWREIRKEKSAEQTVAND